MILALTMNQVRDPNRGSFYVKLQADGKAKHLGKQVYKDAFGVRFIIVDEEAE